MNLNKKTVSEIEKSVNSFNKWIELSPVDLSYEVEYKTFFDTPLEECVLRDSKREHPIGAKVITELYNRYKNTLNGNV